MVNGIYIDDRKDTTLVVKKVENNKYSKNVVVEEYHVVVEPGGFHLTHITNEDSKGNTISCCLNEVVKNSFKRKGFSS